TTSRVRRMSLSPDIHASPFVLSAPVVIDAFAGVLEHPTKIGRQLIAESDPHRLGAVVRHRTTRTAPGIRAPWTGHRHTRQPRHGRVRVTSLWHRSHCARGVTLCCVMLLPSQPPAPPPSGSVRRTALTWTPSRSHRYGT